MEKKRGSVSLIEATRVRAIASSADDAGARVTRRITDLIIQ